MNTSKSFVDSLREIRQQGRYAELGKKISKGELIPTKVANYENKLILYRNGRTIYIENYKNVYEYKFNLKTNPHLLLLFLAQNPTKTFSVIELDKKLKAQRHNANSTEERRIRDTIQEIRRKLKLNESSDFLTVDRKIFGIRCSSEFR